MIPPIDDLLTKYVGRTLRSIKTPFRHEGRSGKVYEGFDYYADADDPTYIALMAEARIVRIWFPGTVGTMDYRTDRLNVRFHEADDNGVFTIAQLSWG